MPALNQGDLIGSADHAFDAAIYVHWPFCAKKCPYCDFNSHVRERVDQKAWRDAMLTEIAAFAQNFPRLTPKSVFFGGGTPSLMPPETTAAIIEAISEAWGASSTFEITLEANPSSVEAARFRDYAAAGVNRVSVGVQSLRDRSLKFLGRLHGADEARRALEVAQDNFSRVSFDLIYALPGQSLDDWREELSEALALEPSHLSLYQLTIEEGTAFYHQYHRGKFTLPDEDEAAELYQLTQELTEKAGLPAYEISNHARPGEESRHNLAYWQGDYYVGIGPGAHGRLPALETGAATAHQQVKRPEDWLKAVQKQGLGLKEAEPVDAHDRAAEAIMMGLRLKAGIDKMRFERQFGLPLSSCLNKAQAHDLVSGGYLANESDALKLTAKGLPLLNFLLPKLIA